MEQEKLPDLSLATGVAIRMSIDHPNTDVYIIQERENYFVECGGSSLIRIYETLHGIFRNGKKQKL